MASYYKTGTITVTAGSAAVTGVGTAFVANVKVGDILQQGGSSGVVKTVNSDTSLTLENVWGGTTAAGTANFAILHSGESWFSNGAASAALTAIATIMAGAAWAGHPSDLANPHQVSAVQAAQALSLTPAADKFLYFTGAASASLSDIKAGPRALLALTGAADKIGYFTGASTAALADFTATGRALVAAASQDAAITALGILGKANVWAAGNQFFAIRSVPELSIADDAAGTIAVPSTRCLVLISNRSNSSTTWKGLIHITTGPTLVVIASSGASAATTGVLTGTTGTDGTTTLSVHTDGNLYIENRSGSPRVYVVTFLNYQ